MSNDLLTQNMSLEIFCSIAQELHANDHGDFVMFTLSGNYDGTQAVIDPIVDRIPDHETFSGRRDYDSLLGIHKDIVVSSALTVFPVAKTEDTLARNIHVSAYFTNTMGGFDAQVHKIPNMCIAKWGTHNMIRVLIPELYHDNRSSYLSQDEQRIFYEQGLLPAIQYLLGDQAAEWPATYTDEMFRARGHNGQLSFQSKMVGDWHLNELGDCIRESLAAHGCSWGTGLVFLHQIRGVKHSSSHALDRGAAVDALDTFLRQNNLDPQTIQASGEWWVDVGVEISSDDEKCLAWRTDSHYHIVKTVCRLPDNVARRITSVGSSKYTRDMASHLPAVSGCRISPGPRACGPFGVRYLQMYLTDKAHTYRQEQGRYGKYITCADILKGKAPKYIDSLYALYRNAMETGNSLARLEVRVPLRSASKVLLDLDLKEDLLRGSLVSFDRTVWWSLRSYRALALKFVLEWQAEGEVKLRAKESALLLTAAAAWMLNGLHSTPDKGASSKELMASILPHVHSAGADPDILAYGTPTADDDVLSDDTDSEDDLPPQTRRRRDAVTLPSFPYGLVFLRNIRLGPRHPVPRFYNSSQFLSPRAFRFFFGVDVDDVDAEFFRIGLVEKANPSRVPNKTKRTPTWQDNGQVTTTPSFNLAARGLQLPPPVHDHGSDVEDEDEPMDAVDGEEADEPDIDTLLTKLWRQFLLDITQRAPNPKRVAEPSHCILTAEQRTRVSEATYTNTKLSDYFRDCQWKYAEPADWKVIFDRFFPPRGHKFPEKTQNYLGTNYIIMWERMKERLNGDDRSYRQIRRALWEKFDRLYWMPWAQTNRIWWTKYFPGFSKSSGLKRTAPAPLILINGGPPRW